MSILFFFLIVTHILFFIAGMFHARLERGYKASKSLHPNEHLLKIGSKWTYRESHGVIYSAHDFSDRSEIIFLLEGVGAIPINKDFFLATAKYISGPIEADQQMES